MYPSLPGILIGDTVMFDEIRARDFLEKLEMVRSSVEKKGLQKRSGRTKRYLEVKNGRVG